MTILCVEQVVTYSNIFTYYEKNVAKFGIFFAIIIVFIKDGMNDGRL
jgi:hypothetical protein